MQIKRSIFNEDGSLIKNIVVYRKVDIRPGAKSGTRYRFKGLGKQIYTGESGDFVFE